MTEARVIGRDDEVGRIAPGYLADLVVLRDDPLRNPSSLCEPLLVQSTGGGQWATMGKLVAFGVILLAGAFALGRQCLHETRAALTPFLPGGATGLLAAMGFIFIALQGFDLVAAVADEVEEPARTIPRASWTSPNRSCGRRSRPRSPWAARPKP